LEYHLYKKEYPILSRVETKSLVLEAQIVVQVSMDIVQNRQRLEDVKEGVRKAMIKGLYEEGLEFEVKKLHFKVK
jgi:hypothetical protein